jgi:hypothetical protein
VSRSWATGSTSRWRKIRAAVLNENAQHNAGRCTLAIPGVCTGTASCVHHVHGRDVTGDDPRYLAAVCTPCNLHVGRPRPSDPRPKGGTQW